MGLPFSTHSASLVRLRYFLAFGQTKASPSWGQAPTPTPTRDAGRKGEKCKNGKTYIYRPASMAVSVLSKTGNVQSWLKQELSASSRPPICHLHYYYIL
jgi:hypothetical protein